MMPRDRVVAPFCVVHGTGLRVTTGASTSKRARPNPLPRKVLRTFWIHLTRLSGHTLIAATARGHGRLLMS